MTQPLETIARELVLAFLKHETRDHRIFHFTQADIPELTDGYEAFVTVRRHRALDEGRKLLEAVKGYNAEHD